MVEQERKEEGEKQQHFLQFLETFYSTFSAPLLIAFAVLCN